MAERLWNGYIARLQEAVRRGSLSAASLEEARELVAWSRLAVLCMRAHAQGRLGCLRLAGVYDNAPQAPSPRIVQTSV